MQSESPDPRLRWDIFCRVIDNFGDIGVCWRLACNLAQRGQTVRLWADDPSALGWMAPHGAPGVEVRAWTTPLDLTGILPGDVILEAFGCDVAIEFIACYADNIRAIGQKCVWINLEYLSAEDFVVRSHGLPSPVMQGPGSGLTKHFFYPGFCTGTGGLLREADLLQAQARFDRQAWLAQFDIAWQGRQLISLFCYEPKGLAQLLHNLASAEQATCLLVTHGRPSAAVQRVVMEKNQLQPLWNERQMLTIFYLPRLSQLDYDHLLWACDVNFVRGEDSLVRALWAGKALVWQIYPQDDGAHDPKLTAFLDWLGAPASLRAYHQHWNTLSLPADADTSPHADSHFTPADWQDCVAKAKAYLLNCDDLSSKLLGFITKNH